MNRDKGNDKDIRRASFERETSEDKHAENEKKIKGNRRSLMRAPVDPNSPADKLTFPPGLHPADAADPGRSTPGSPPVDNRFGKKR